jgi:hypothetical protein
VSALAQHGRDEVPVPGGSTAAMDQRERRHAKACGVPLFASRLKRLLGSTRG